MQYITRPLQVITSLHLFAVTKIYKQYYSSINLQQIRSSDNTIYLYDVDPQFQSLNLNLKLNLGKNSPSPELYQGFLFPLALVGDNSLIFCDPGLFPTNRWCICNPFWVSVSKRENRK